MCQATTARMGRSLADSAASAAPRALSRLKLSSRSQLKATVGTAATISVPITAVRQMRGSVRPSTMTSPSASPSQALRVKVL